MGTIRYKCNECNKKVITACILGDTLRAEISFGKLFGKRGCKEIVPHSCNAEDILKKLDKK